MKLCDLFCQSDLGVTNGFMGSNTGKAKKHWQYISVYELTQGGHDILTHKTFRADRILARFFTTTS